MAVHVAVDLCLLMEASGTINVLATFWYTGVRKMLLESEDCQAATAEVKATSLQNIVEQAEAEATSCKMDVTSLRESWIE